MGKLFGIVLTPDASFGHPYRGAFDPLRAVDGTGKVSPQAIAQANATLAAAQAANARLMTNFNGTRAWYEQGGALVVEKWKANLQAFHDHITLDPYWDTDGNMVVNDLDEPQDGSGWGGPAVPYADVHACLAFHKTLYPAHKLGLQTTTAYLLAAPGGPSFWAGVLDWCIINYNTRNLSTPEPSVWFPPMAADAYDLGLKLYVNINASSSMAAGKPIDAAHLNTWARYFLTSPACAGLILYRWGLNIDWQDVAFKPVLNALVKLAQK